VNTLHINIARLPTLTRIFFNLRRKIYGTIIGLRVDVMHTIGSQPTTHPPSISSPFRISIGRLAHRAITGCAFAVPNVESRVLSAYRKNAQWFRTIRKLGLRKFNKLGGLIRYKAVINSNEPESPTRHLLSTAHLYIARNGVHYI
jgi:hypothetical protein